MKTRLGGKNDVRYLSKAWAGTLEPYLIQKKNKSPWGGIKEAHSGRADLA
jgi:hypothetical protein